MSQRAWHELSADRRLKVKALLSLVYHTIGHSKHEYPAIPDWREEADAMREGVEAAVAVLDKAGEP